jgi:hypothetical protein
MTYVLMNLLEIITCHTLFAMVQNTGPNFVTRGKGKVRSAVTRCACEKIAQNIAKPNFSQN